MDTQTTKPVGSRRANIKDVAAALNVAVSTISNAYNRPDQLSAALRQRVLETADRLGYPGPNPMARGLRTKSSGTIVVLLGQPLASAFADPITAGTLEGITDALSESGLAIQLVPSDARSGLPAADGVLVLCPDRNDPLLGQVIRHGQPTVLVDHPAEGFLTCVRADDEMAARGAIGHLTGLGHSRIGIVIDRLGSDATPGFIKVKKNPDSSFPRTIARLRGFRAGAEAAGLDWADVPVYQAGENTSVAAAAALDALLSDRKKTTAILCVTDQLAVGVIAGAKAKEIAIPERLSVVGFDDSHLARSSNPPLTSVRQPHVEKGRAAVRSLLAQIRDEPAPAVGRLAPKIVVRGSSAAPAS